MSNQTAHIFEEHMCQYGLEYGYMIRIGNDVYRPIASVPRVFKRRCDASRWAKRHGHAVTNWYHL